MTMPPVQPAPGDSPDDGFVDELSANVDHPIAVVSDSDSISDEENGGHAGYELLSQDPENCINNDDEEDDSNFPNVGEDFANTEMHVFNHHTLLLPIPSDPLEHAEDENYEKDVHMDEDHIEKIKDVMKGITLPTSNLPPWANVIPEEEWKAELFSQLSSKKIKDMGVRGKCSSSHERKFEESTSNSHIETKDEVEETE